MPRFRTRPGGGAAGDVLGRPYGARYEDRECHGGWQRPSEQQDVRLGTAAQIKIQSPRPAPGRVVDRGPRAVSAQRAHWCAHITGRVGAALLLLGPTPPKSDSAAPTLRSTARTPGPVHVEDVRSRRNRPAPRRSRRYFIFSAAQLGIPQRVHPKEHDGYKYWVATSTRAHLHEIAPANSRTRGKSPH